jgi:hypothetical protein
MINDRVSCIAEVHRERFGRVFGHQSPHDQQRAVPPLVPEHCPERTRRAAVRAVHDQRTPIADIETLEGAEAR